MLHNLKSTGPAVKVKNITGAEEHSHEQWRLCRTTGESKGHVPRNMAQKKVSAQQRGYAKSSELKVAVLARSDHASGLPLGFWPGARPAVGDVSGRGG